MLVTKEVLILLAIVLAVCLIGFKKYIWFISIGYGLSVSAVGAGILILFANRIDLANILFCIVLIVYGFRLGGYLAFRELKNAAYNSKMKTEISDGSHMPFFAKIMLWISCAVLYITMTAPVIYRNVNGIGGDLCQWIGMIISVSGIAIESISDMQKSASKKINPHRFCDTGLFKFVRCPNYLGELIIWTGVFVSGFTAKMTPPQWIASVIGYLGIIYIMFSGARRLEIRHDKSYGNDPDYVKYKNNTPIMIPFVPLYSVKKHKWLVG